MVVSYVNGYEAVYSTRNNGCVAHLLLLTGPPLPPASQAFRSASQRSRPEVEKKNTREGRRSVQGGPEGIGISLTTFGIDYVSREGASIFCADLDAVPKGDLITPIASTINNSMLHVSCTEPQHA